MKNSTIVIYVTTQRGNCIITLSLSIQYVVVVRYAVVVTAITVLWGMVKRLPRTLAREIADLPERNL